MGCVCSRIGCDCFCSLGELGLLQAKTILRCVIKD